MLYPITWISLHEGESLFISGSELGRGYCEKAAAFGHAWSSPPPLPILASSAEPPLWISSDLNDDPSIQSRGWCAEVLPWLGGQVAGTWPPAKSIKVGPMSTASTRARLRWGGGEGSRPVSVGGKLTMSGMRVAVSHGEYFAHSERSPSCQP